MEPQAQEALDTSRDILDCDVCGEPNRAPRCEECEAARWDGVSGLEDRATVPGLEAAPRATAGPRAAVPTPTPLTRSFDPTEPFEEAA